MRMRSLLVVLVAAALAACKAKEQPTPAAATPAQTEEVGKLQQENAALKETVGQKTALLNQVQEELAVLASTGELLETTRKDIESGAATREQGQVLRENIAKAKQALEKQATQIKALQARMTGSERELKQLMDMLTRMLLERQEEVGKLDEQIATLRKEKGAAEAERDAERRQRESEETRRKSAETELDTGYVAIGTEEELLKTKVLEVQKGGFAGLKKKVKLAPVETFEHFRKVSFEKDREFPLGKIKKFDIATGQPLASCTWEKNGDETTLKVEDPKAFWTQKVLVIVVTR